MSILVAKELGRWYGQVVGLNELDLVLEGGLVGLIGPNGAGKSTLLKLIVGEIKPSRGTVEVLGEQPFANRGLFRRLGFCPQQDALYDDMSGHAMVRFLLRLSGFGAREAGERAERALQRTGLAQSMHRRIDGYSKGMRQRVKVAQAIAHDPELLVLDEPLGGLDPIGRREVLDLLRELGDEGVHVILSSHVLHEVQDLTDEIVLLHRGRLLAQGPVPEIRKLLTSYPRRVELRVREPRRLATALVEFDDVLSVRFSDDDGLVAVETRDVDGF
ncbi:MAG: ABC transporter ATP-binding protein, partial [Planctomycetota bacterium]|nr:ABC transporter ATP-binding protein [Planctomycetota bacterium]